MKTFPILLLITILAISSSAYPNDFKRKKLNPQLYAEVMSSLDDYDESKESLEDLNNHLGEWKVEKRDSRAVTGTPLCATVDTAITIKNNEYIVLPNNTYIDSVCKYESNYPRPTSHPGSEICYSLPKTGCKTIRTKQYFPYMLKGSNTWQGVLPVYVSSCSCVALKLS